ncbi:MAG: response regulator [Candidatus Scalindua sp.]
MKEKKILIVEDDPDYADLILDIFDTEGVEGEVVLMRDGQEIIDYLQETDIDSSNGKKPQIDLIILDLNLPKIDGMEVLKFIKKNSKYCSIPVVIHSTSSNQETIDDAYKNGANGYFTKPASYEDLVEKVQILKKCC